MCGIYSNPYETARSLTAAAASKIVINQTGKTVEESNAELGRQLAIVYKTLLRELQREDMAEDDLEHNHTHSHDDGHEHVHSHGHDHDGSSHSHSHSHGHDGHGHSHAGDHEHPHTHSHEHSH